MKRIMKFGCLGVLALAAIVAVLAVALPKSTPTEAKVPPNLAILAPTVTPIPATQVAFPTVTPAPVALPWYSGGTLHDATIAVWQAGSDRDKLATASDWYVTARGLKNLQADDEYALRTLSAAMIECIDTLGAPGGPIATSYDISVEHATVPALICANFLAVESDYAALAATLED